ncbi:hypothetical protein, partial [uncultured Rhodoblastus sp.]|uniref:hypothetical protein n=1 Tax=uncultured Rhodoblastus sp. TaxID=543037 RepID=UPI0025CF1371
MGRSRHDCPSSLNISFPLLIEARGKFGNDGFGSLFPVHRCFPTTADSSKPGKAIIFLVLNVERCAGPSLVDAATFEIIEANREKLRDVSDRIPDHCPDNRGTPRRPKELPQGRRGAVARFAPISRVGIS